MTEHEEKVLKILDEAVIYVPAESEGIRINFVEAGYGYFMGIGEETGEQYQIDFYDVDLKNDMFFKLVLVE